jgi:choline dehydrogenase-like flavoprotein
MAAEAAPYKPQWPSLPESPTSSSWSDLQWEVLFALMDAIIPSLVPESANPSPIQQAVLPDTEYEAIFQESQTDLAVPPDPELLRAYLTDSPSRNAACVKSTRRVIQNLPAKLQRDLGGAMTLLTTRLGSLVLTGSMTPMHTRPVLVRESIIQSWKTAWLPAARVLQKSITLVAKSMWAQTSDEFLRISSYADIPPDLQPGADFDYKFLQFEPHPEAAVLKTDVVVVGSGCGGGVVAKILAEAGHDVIVVDKGYYFPPSQLPMKTAEGMHYLFETRGLVTSDDASTNLQAGSCWGGGGTVNWSVALQTQGFVRREWAEEHGLPFFATQEYQDCLDRVCDFMGVHTANVRQNHRGQVLLDGARKLGWDAKVAPQSTGHSEHLCGHCHLGCGGGQKQGPAVSWLPAAARAGAQFMEGFKVDRVTFEDGFEGPVKGDRIATGVVGQWTSRDENGGVSGPADKRVQRKVIIKARKVILSSGTLWSPMLLLNSGLKNPHIGQNLRIHPVNMVAAVYDEDVRPWEGGILTSYCTAFEDLDGKGHGVKLEPTMMLPYAVMVGLPWHSGQQWKMAALKYRQMAGFISLARDRDSGSIVPGPGSVEDRLPVLKYTPSAFDTGNIMEGVIALAKMCYITGAREIVPCLPGTKSYIRPKSPRKTEKTVTAGIDEEDAIDLGVGDPDFQAWLETIRAAGNKPPGTTFFSAHQMGTCRMSSHKGAGVVDPHGKVWDIEGLYVADASVFPSASGVNPMVTNMAIADWIARGIGRELKREKTH